MIEKFKQCYILINYGNGVESSVYHVVEGMSTLELIASLLLQRNPQQENDDGETFGVVLARLAKQFAKLNRSVKHGQRVKIVNEMLDVYHSIEDQPETIEYGHIGFDETPTPRLSDKQILEAANNIL